MKKILLLAALGLAAGSPSFAQFNIGNGAVKDLYLTNCSACHGLQLEGGIGSSLLDDIWAHGSSDEAIIKVITHGIKDTPMIPYGQILDDKQIRSLLVYIKEQREIIDKDALSKRLQPKNGVFNSSLHSYKLEKVAAGSLIDPNGEPLDTHPDATLWGFAFEPNGDILATQRGGILWRFDKTGTATQIKNTPEILYVGAESGLFDIVLHPEYSENGWIYIAYSHALHDTKSEEPLGMTAIARGRIDDGAWTDHQTIYQAEDRFYNKSRHHWGGRLLFKDGYLYASIGDRQDIEKSQDLTSPLGKIIRLHDDGAIPKDNPFVATTGACKAIWTFGNRNAQGFALHPETGDIWSSEHGPRGGDELNIIHKGQNYGWPVVTYGINYNGRPITDLTHQEGMLDPVHSWTPSIATAGIAFYQGDVFPQWKGDLFVGGMWAEELHRVRIEDNKVVADEIVLKNQGRVRQVVNAPDGHLYLSLTLGDPRVSTLYRLVPNE